MGSLDEYAAQHPELQEAPAEALQPRDVKEWSARREDLIAADELRSSILRRIEAGHDAKIILYSALDCIGLYASDAEWTAAAKSKMDSIYADLAEQSILIDSQEVERQRLAEQQAEYICKLQRDLKRQLNRLEKIEQALSDALEATESPAPTTE